MEERAMAAQVEQVKGSMSELTSELAAVREQEQARCATGEQMGTLEGRMSELAAEAERNDNFDRWLGTPEGLAWFRRVLVTGEQLEQVEAWMQGAL